MLGLMKEVLNAEGAELAEIKYQDIDDELLTMAATRHHATQKLNVAHFVVTKKKRAISGPGNASGRVSDSNKG
jgi:hypothetical protein